MTANSAPASYLAFITATSSSSDAASRCPSGKAATPTENVAGLADERDQLGGVLDPALGARPTRCRGRRAGRRAARARCARRRRRASPGSGSSSSVVCPTQVRCAIGSIEVSRAIRPVIAMVRSRVGAAGAVGHRDERRPQRLELADRAPQHLLAGLVLGREELEGEGPPALPQQVADARGRPSDMAPRIRVYARRMTSAARRMGRPSGTRAASATTSSPRCRTFVAHPGRAGSTGSVRTRSAWSSTPASASPAASGSGRRSAGGATTPSAEPTRPRSRCCAPAPRSSCCTPARWSTTTTWTPPTYAAAGRPPTARSSSSTASTAGPPSAEQYGASAAILLGDLLLELVRRAAAHLRPARRTGCWRRSATST